jgi:hypothetical protein
LNFSVKASSAVSVFNAVTRLLAEEQMSKLGVASSIEPYQL